MGLMIQGGRLLDPASRTDQSMDILIEEGTIADIAPAGSLKQETDWHIDASQWWVLPGLVDMHVHLREPGEEYKEDIKSGCAAAVFGGFTTLVAMPNTQPVVDNACGVAFVIQRSQQLRSCRVLPAGAVSVGQKGEQLAPFGQMRRAGAVALSDDGHPVAHAALMRSALEYARNFNLPILSHAEDPTLSRGCSMHEGHVSMRLGLDGAPRVSEDVAVSRDILLAEYTGGRLHICHVSTHGAVELIRQAKARGVRLTAEATPHHFTLTHQAVETYNTFAKVNPPLREDIDRLAVIEGLRDGTLDAIATDHAPHSSLEKEVPFAQAAPGMIGLQTALPLALDLWRTHGVPLLDVVKRLTWGPARALGLPYGSVKKGGAADLILVDPEKVWELTADQVLSRSANSPFLNQPLKGKVQMTFCQGRIVYTYAGAGLKDLLRDRLAWGLKRPDRKAMRSDPC